MKRAVTISLTVFVLVVGAILLVSVFSEDRVDNSVANNPSPEAEVPDSTAVEKTTPVYSSLEVAKHNSKEDCWLIIDKKIYNVTSYIPKHPGGPETIIPFCGGDATEVFSSHPSRVADILKTFFVGNFEK